MLLRVHSALASHMWVCHTLRHYPLVMEKIITKWSKQFDQSQLLFIIHDHLLACGFERPLMTLGLRSSQFCQQVQNIKIVEYFNQEEGNCNGSINFSICISKAEGSVL